MTRLILSLSGVGIPTRVGVIAVTLSMWGTASGCFTTLGYVQENLKIRHMQDQTTYIPSYAEVKTWAYDVADAYDSRATLNRHMIHFGALFAIAATGALAGLGAFDSGSPAITGIPIGTAFLAGVAAVYSSEDKAVIYDLGSKYIKDLIVLSDKRVLSGTTADKERRNEALCLRQDVNEVIRRVGNHIALLEPKNVVERLKEVGRSKTTQDAAAAALQVAKDASGDLSDLRPPVASSCKSDNGGSD